MCPFGKRVEQIRGGARGGLGGYGSSPGTASPLTSKISKSMGAKMYCIWIL